jgi:hypothetical protein
MWNKPKFNSESLGMSDRAAYEACDKVWDALPKDYEDAFNVLQLVVDRFVSSDETGHNRELFIGWLRHCQHSPRRPLSHKQF